MSCRNGYHVRGMNDSTQGENWWKRLSGGLKRTSSSLGSSITAIVSHRPLEPETLDALEDELVRADLGQDMAVRIVDALSQGRYPQGLSPDEVKAFLAGEIEKTLTPVARPAPASRGKAAITSVQAKAAGTSLHHRRSPSEENLRRFHERCRCKTSLAFRKRLSMRRSERWLRALSG